MIQYLSFGVEPGPGVQPGTGAGVCRIGGTAIAVDGVVGDWGVLLPAGGAEGGEQSVADGAAIVDRAGSGGGACGRAR
ncbi:MAG TPA: hypothetical protein PLB18_11750, partial [Acidobacteriota bacterium]|nr:hypothetical protein [Acidobacteriota bacterium]